MTCLMPCRGAPVSRVGCGSLQRGRTANARTRSGRRDAFVGPNVGIELNAEAGGFGLVAHNERSECHQGKAACRSGSARMTG